MFLSATLGSIKTSIQTIEKITDNLQFENLREELFRNLVSSVHLIADYEERIRALLTPEDAEIFKAFLYVNNQLKHDVNLELFYYEVAGASYPMFYPMRYGEPGICWKDFPDNGRKKARGKREHYERYLMDNDVKVSMEQIRLLIEKYSNT